MGVYVITINNFSAKLTETSRLKLAVDNTYSVGNEYRNQELSLFNSTATVSGAINGTIIYSVKNSLYYLIGWINGGSNFLYTLPNGSDSWGFIKNINNHPRITGNGSAWIYSDKLDKYYVLGAGGLGEYDNDFVATVKGYNFVLGGSSYTYDSKRNYIICNSARPDGVAGNWLTQLYLDAPTTTEGPYINQFARNHLAQMTNNRIKFLTYSLFDDNYYFTDTFSIVRISAETGGGQAVVQKGTEILGLMIEENSSFGYYAYQDGNDIKLSKFNLTNYSDVYPIVNLGDLSHFVFLYVGKVVLINYKKGNAPTDPWKTISYNTDLTLDLTYEKNAYHIQTGTTTYPSTIIHDMNASAIDNTKFYPKQNPAQIIRPLSNNEVDIHIPAQIGGLVSQGYTTSHMQNINPVTPYPTVTTPTVVDCCLDELKCDINTKLASKSCEVTNRAIVGRHYGGMADDSELLEALLWITTFDCLTCDEIEKLRCITSKI